MFTATEAVPVAKVVAGNKRYPGVVALDNVNFTLNKGEVRALLGKNGAGKSTHNRLVVGSNPTGATIHNKGLANKPANPFSFAFELGQVMGQVSFFPSDSDG